MFSSVVSGFTSVRICLSLLFVSCGDSACPTIWQDFAPRKSLA